MSALMKTSTNAAAALAVIVIVGACAAPSRLPAAHVASIQITEMEPAKGNTSVKVVSLNAAHSRSMGIHQLLQSADKARENLDAIVAMLERENADVVALQEIDGPSVWSGRFDHVGYLAREAGYAATVRGTHMKTPGLDYGTALMARYPLGDAKSVGFGHVLSMPRKGFVISRLQWPGRLNTEVDVVSVHLDPLRSKVRARQVKALIAVIEQRDRPVVVMGDFNEDWYDENSAVRLLGDSLGLKTHGVHCVECHTHRRMKNFVDWILVSPELSIDEFEILDDDISDHYAVAATLHFNGASRDRGAAAH